jgi:hypothetical protein
VNFCEIVASFGALANQLAHRVTTRELLDERRPRLLVVDLGPHGFEHHQIAIDPTTNITMSLRSPPTPLSKTVQTPPLK